MLQNTHKRQLDVLYPSPRAKIIRARAIAILEDRYPQPLPPRPSHRSEPDLSALIVKVVQEANLRRNYAKEVFKYFIRSAYVAAMNALIDFKVIRAFRSVKRLFSKRKLFITRY